MLHFTDVTKSDKNLSKAPVSTTNDDPNRDPNDKNSDSQNESEETDGDSGNGRQGTNGNENNASSIGGGVYSNKNFKCFSIKNLLTNY